MSKNTLGTVYIYTPRLAKAHEGLEQCLSITLSLELCKRKVAGDKSLGQNICQLIKSRHTHHIDLLGEDLFSDKEQIQLHVLSSGVKNRIMSQGDSTGIVTKNDRNGVRNLKFRKKRLNPSDLSCYESHAPIF